MSRLFADELRIPGSGKRMRATRRMAVPAGNALAVFDSPAPGCIFHWWMTCNLRKPEDARDPVHDLRLRMYYDGEPVPAVDVPLGRFFGLLLDRDTFETDSAAIKILPRNSFNCYLPIPFAALRMELENRGDRDMRIWFMADWDQYAANAALTSRRLHVRHAAAFPAEPHSSFLMADLAGDGFVAGIVKGVRTRDRGDAWFHSGGDLWLLDGETDPHVLRGIGGEDAFNMSFGIHARQTDWVGAPFVRRLTAPDGSPAGDEAVMYRFFGPDPVRFVHSAVVRFGSRANDIETVTYAYLRPSQPPPGLTVAAWSLAGPFPCTSPADFDRREWAEEDAASWPDRWQASFGQYAGEDGPAEFRIPVPAATEHGWCDFARYFRGRTKTNMGAQPCDVSACAVGTLSVPEAGEYIHEVGFDDWLRLWIDGAQAHAGRHDRGFAVDRVRCRLPSGATEIRVKLSNFDNVQWRLWAFSLTARPAG